ncbi:hypothetical protein [Kitasatospora sp. NPDC059327]|uniref:hypothetical protein n=1 Tax=Kitasatospora sp. NPDC059327 TaxID=3346803 RepID=UPI0036B6DE0D
MTEVTPQETAQRRADVIAQRLAHLIGLENARRDPNSPVGLAELAKRSGGVLSESALRYMRRGRGATGAPVNPTVDTLDAVGRLFGLTNGAAYFTSDAQAKAVNRQLEALNSLASLRGPSGAVIGAEVETGDATPEASLGLLARATTLSPSNLQVLTDMAQRLMELEEEAAGNAIGRSRNGDSK